MDVQAFSDELLRLAKVELETKHKNDPFGVKEAISTAVAKTLMRVAQAAREAEGIKED